MIDWHTHVLPGIDDGARTVQESVSMLESHAAQGVDTVIATPHFYANEDSVESFLKRRDKAFSELSSHLPERAPKILLGAEVRYYPGISRLEELKALRIEGSKLLLLEMPMTRWTEYMIRELTELAGRGSVKIVLAHVERYLKLQPQSVWDRIAESGILMQTNASFFTSLLSRRRAVSLLREGSIQLLGTDCHNMTSRPPNISGAVDLIRKKLGEDCIAEMNEYGKSLLGI